MPELFLTGATGFVGRHLVRRLEVSGPAATMLVRQEGGARPQLAAGWRICAGDLLESRTYEGELPRGGTVVHLAAATGSASAAAHWRVNVEGTRALLAASKRAGVRRFVHVSSIAAGFGDQRHYPYAQAKAAAEVLVRESGVPYVIVRPTIVLGPGSPILAALQRLARAPVGLVFGAGRIRVQPVHVEDLARVLHAIVTASDLADPPLVEVGGPERLTMRELLVRIRSATTGRSGPMVGVPIEPLRSLLAILERALPGRLPLTAGQLASFINDGEAARHPLVARLEPEFAAVGTMIA